MTPAINTAKKNIISYHVHEYAHDAASESYGDEAAQKLGVSSERVFKTLVVSVDNKALIVAIIPVSSMLSMKLIAKAYGGKKAIMALKTDVERSTGYVLGGVSPLGQKKRLRTFIDSSAVQFTTVFVSAGKRGLEIELSPQDLQQLTQAKLAELCQ
jgi:Cys-tRNA(Pro)/Cys-tRNA(Cys) deacylase